MPTESLKIFLVGVLESFFYSFNTKTIQRNMQFLSFLVSIISAFLWYYVIVTVEENIRSFWLILAYGCANGLGDIVTIRFDTFIGKMENRILDLFSRIKLRWPIEFIRKERVHRRKKNSNKK